MKSLNRQKVTIYYANYSGNTDVVDSSGDFTGEKEIAYGTPIAIQVTMGAVSGKTSLNTYGIAPEYDRVMISDDINCPINENTILWVDNAITEKNDYVVQSVAKSLNFVSYGIKKVQ